MTTKDKGITLPDLNIIGINVKNAPYNAIGNNITDDTTAIQAALDFLNSVGGGVLLFPRGMYKTSRPLVSYTNITLRGEGETVSQIIKATNTVGSGTSRARTGTVTDSYVVDSILSIFHTDGVSDTIFASNICVDSLGLVGNNFNTYGIYAPRVLEALFKDTLVSKVITAHFTYESWMVSFDRVTHQAISTGLKHADDGTGLSTGASVSLDDYWVNFDNTINAPVSGVELFGLKYFQLTNCSVDNATRLDNSIPNCYKFDTCIGGGLNGCAAQDGRAQIINSLNSILDLNHCGSLNMIANAAWGTAAGILNDNSTLTFLGADYTPFAPGAGIFNMIIQNGAKQIEMNSIMPSGGTTTITYSGGSTRTVYYNGQCTVFDSTGRRNSIPQSVIIPYSVSMTPDISLGNDFVITATNNTAFAINAPLGTPGVGAIMDVTIRNTSGGALGVATWNAIFKMIAWVQPGNGFSASIRFRYDGTNWVEKSRSGVTVPN